MQIGDEETADGTEDHPDQRAHDQGDPHRESIVIEAVARDQCRTEHDRADGKVDPAGGDDEGDA